MDNAVEEYVEMMAEIRERIKNKKLTPPKIKEILPESVQEGQPFTDFSGTTESPFRSNGPWRSINS